MASEEETCKLLTQELSKARLGLLELYEFLPHDRNPSEEEISDLIDYSELKDLPVAWRKKLANEIRRQNLAQKSKAEFIAGGMEVLYAWVYVEAMNKASDAVLEFLRHDRERGGLRSKRPQGAPPG